MAKEKGLFLRVANHILNGMLMLWLPQKPPQNVEHYDQKLSRASLGQWQINGLKIYNSFNKILTKNFERYPKNY